MLFYPAKRDDTLNRGKAWEPERITGRVMVNPLRPVRRLTPGTLAICDSGAFQDLGTRPRLQPWQALERQLRYEEQLRWHLNDHNWHFEAVVIYDQMAGVDEAIINGKKVKVRGTHETAKKAVEETLRAAEYYASQRARIRGRIAFAGQGIEPDQYINDCVRPMMKLMTPSDWFSFGGFCIIGRHRSLISVFKETFGRVLDLLIPFGIRRYHLLGVCVPAAVEYAAELAEDRRVVLSTDSSAPEFSALCKGARYEGGTYKDTDWTPADKHVNYCPVDLAHDNVRDYTAYALSLGGNEYEETP